MIVNGFEVEKFNIYDLPEGKKNHTCPLCSHTRKKKTQKCLNISWDRGIATCSHCGEVIQLHEWKKKDKQENYEVPEWENNTKLSDNVVKWFEETRGIDQFILRTFKITEGVESMPTKASGWQNMNTIQFNYFRNTELLNIKYRTGGKDFKLYKGAEKLPYNIDRVVGQDVIYCVEGEMDVLAAAQAGIYSAISPPNGFTLGHVNLDWLNNDVDHFINAKKIVLAFDQDEPGQNGTKEFIRRFGAHKCFLVDLKDCKDSNDYLLKYGKEELRKVLENHIEIPLDNVSTYNDIKEGVRDFFLNGMPKGFISGTMPTLDKYFSINSAQPLLVTGIPSHGKSEVVDQLILGYAKNYNFNIAFASPENKPNELHAAKLAKKLHGIAPSHASHFTKAFEACEEFIEKHINFIDLEDGYTLEKVLLKAEELVYRKGIKVLVIDPFNKIQYKGKVNGTSGNRINDYTNTYLTLVYEFCVKFDIIPIIVAHPNKMEKGSDGKRVVPDFYDVKGGGEWYDMMPHGIVVYRDFEHNYTMIKTLKVKFSHLGESGKEAYFKYNMNNGRYEDVGVENVEDIINLNFELAWDNESWISKDVDKAVQQELDTNKDLTYDPDAWTNSQKNEDEECPF